MKSEEVKIWLEKYFEGESTLEEERMLAEFFRRDSVPEELMPYRKWFSGVAKMDEMSAPSAGSARFTISGDKSAGKTEDERFTVSAGQPASETEDERFTVSADQPASGTEDERFTDSAGQPASGTEDERFTVSADQPASGTEEERFTVSADQPASGTEEERFTVSPDKSPSAGDGQLLAAENGDSEVAGDGGFFTAAGLAAMIEERGRRKRVRVRSLRYTVTGIAASLVVTLGTLFWYQRQPDYRDTFEDPQQALAVAGETLAFVSAKYNKGLEQLAVMQKLTEATRTVREPLSVLNRGFEKADLFRQEEKP